MKITNINVRRTFNEEKLKARRKRRICGVFSYFLWQGQKDSNSASHFPQLLQVPANDVKSGNYGKSQQTAYADFSYVFVTLTDK